MYETQNDTNVPIALPRFITLTFKLFKNFLSFRKSPHVVTTAMTNALKSQSIAIWWKKLVVEFLGFAITYQSAPLQLP